MYSEVEILTVCVALIIIYLVAREYYCTRIRLRLTEAEISTEAEGFTEFTGIDDDPALLELLPEAPREPPEPGIYYGGVPIKYVSEEDFEYSPDYISIIKYR